MLFVDTSNVNPHPIGWGQLQGAGIDGVMHKATQGDWFVDPDFGRDYADANATGLIQGAYLFWEWMGPHGPQLDLLRSHYTPRAGDMPPAVDMESYRDRNGIWRTPGVDRPWADLRLDLSQMLDQLAGEYGDAWGYFSRDAAGHLALSGHGVWLAQGSAGPLARAEAEQFAPAHLPGCSGPLDWSHTLWRPTA